MAIDPESFWGRNYYQHPPLNDLMVAKAEKILGVHLPPELIALLRIQNGGYTKGFIHPMIKKTSWDDSHVPLKDLAGIVTDPAHRTAQNMLQTAYMTREWGLPPKQVLLSGDGHYWITLDYRKGQNPSVAWLDVECDQDFQISPSFPEFLHGLLPETQ